MVPIYAEANLIFEVIFQISYSYQNSKSYDQKSGISNPLILSGTI